MSFGQWSDRADVYAFSSSVDAATGQQTDVYVLLGTYWCHLENPIGEQLLIGEGIQDAVDASVIFSDTVSIPRDGILTIHANDYRIRAVLPRPRLQSQQVLAKYINAPVYTKLASGSFIIPSGSTVSVPFTALSSSYSVTASYATIAQNVLGSITSASYALTASFALNGGGGGPTVSASYATTASYASLAQTASFIGSIPASQVTHGTFPDNNAYQFLQQVNVGDPAAPGVSFDHTGLLTLAVSGTNTYVDINANGGNGSNPNAVEIAFGDSGSLVRNAGSVGVEVLRLRAGDDHFFGTSSLAVTASFAVSASWAPGGSSVSASYATTASYATVALNVLNGSVSASFATTASAATSITFTPATASYALLAATASCLSTVGSEFVLTGSLAVSGNINATGYQITASFFKGDGTQITGVVSSSYALNAGSSNTATSATTATSASFASNALTANSATSASAATSITFVPATASFALTAGAIDFTPVSASYAVTSSYATTAQNLLGSVVSASYAATASLLLGSVVSASYALTASNAVTASDAFYVPTQVSYFTMEDDFLTGITGGTSGIGMLGWSATTAASISPAQNDPGHPGVINMATTATSGNLQQLYSRTGKTNGILNVVDLNRFVWVIRPSGSITTMKVRLGFSSDITLVNNAGADGIYFTYDSFAGPDWLCRIRHASVNTDFDSGVTASAGSWMQFEARRNATTTTNWDFFINGAFVTSSSGPNLPSGSLVCAAVVESNVNQSRGIDVDYFAMETVNPLGRRWS